MTTFCPKCSSISFRIERYPTSLCLICQGCGKTVWMTLPSLKVAELARMLS